MFLLLSACSHHKDSKLANKKEDLSAVSSSGDKMLNFCLDGIAKDGKSHWSIEGATVDMSSNSSIIDMAMIIAKAYDQRGSVTLTADKGRIDQDRNIVYAQSNVVVTNTEGVYLNTNSLDWDANTERLSTNDFVTVQKDNWQVSGLGAFAQPDLKIIVFKQENTVMVQPDTVITCSGPLNIDYEKNLAIFQDDVIINHKKDKVFSDKMNVFFDPKTKKIVKAVAIGNVKIEQSDNSTFSQKAVYLAKEGKVILTGQPQLFIYPKQGS
jgi:LPS export ABC transporter protein LptC